LWVGSERAGTLAAVGFQAADALRKALAGQKSEEVRTRIGNLLKLLDAWVIQDPETLRAVRSI